jgi:hypothetical protein
LNGDVVAGWLAVVAAGVAVGVGVGVGVVVVVIRAGAAGLAVPVRGRGGAVTVTVGIETLGSVWGAACGASGAACGPCEAGASDAGGVVVGGVSDGVGGVCDDAAPAKQSATSAELLRRSKRLVEIDMTPPSSPRETTPSLNINASRRIDAVRGVGAPVARARACRHQIDVRQWEVRAPQRTRVGVGRSRTRRPSRSASGRRQPAAARTAARQGLTRRRDGPGYRSGSGGPRVRLGLPDRRARYVRRSTHLRWRPRIYLR